MPLCILCQVCLGFMMIEYEMELELTNSRRESDEIGPVCFPPGTICFQIRDKDPEKGWRQPFYLGGQIKDPRGIQETLRNPETTEWAKRVLRQFVEKYPESSVIRMPSGHFFPVLPYGRVLVAEDSTKPTHLDICNLLKITPRA